ncbi:acyl-CoA dehydrogenase family protein [Pseudoteredinibacter isoporae]|uniref:Alkylation response protein AidB-like acyl-CoA dehydrogenase n=1 Tax=Pseudoteredinibacter isoporae TaxID=570281 RepID=A0A7X0JSV2_9GAMM|nr:acyl-CoA dehydrogenase family protein [Pseudoteredinibacter isoporae]MBB6521668.1 alkylation response protein AidB-like acyl-CoA dehydrogenase [Pseudoteredinibacter isoporae]NHO87216.1 pimeloyl-CoA dehydrogenase small subunit [Pseudoteredinibacter isoporae]NIB23152.1 pimeloyl-CoA dehydrogenase small subunit [Pseudoteredinibacter isoporae]
MDFSLSEEQQLLKDSIEKFVTSDYDFEARRELIKSDIGYSAQHWSMFAELGWLGMGFSEENGGYGGSASDIMVIMQAFGKGLVIEPFLANCILAGGAIAELASAQQKEALLASIIGGEQQMALAFAEKQARYNIANCLSTAEKSDGGYVVNGSKIAVLNGGNADTLLLVARTSGGQSDKQGLSLFAVPADSNGLERNSYTTVDGFTGADIKLSNVQLTADALIGEEGAAFAGLEAVMDRARIAVCAEALGNMETLLTKTVEYTKTRKQFGFTLSFFQALQHRMADMFVECQQAQSMLLMAAMKFDARAEDASTAVSAAKARIGQAAKLVGQEAVQLHGGMGVTDELDVGHYFKRLTIIDALFGNTDYHLKRYTAAMG